MSTQGINQLLGELQAMSALAAGKQPAAPTQTPEVDFSSVLQSTLEQVNQVQQTSQELQKRFELGEEGVNIQDVMVTMQKASLSFQTMVQARNKLVSAYQEIMNTQV
ncbi:flagellar hook-basal body complex protein FliE [Vogesella oryzae]|uniref:flagellar hook-basal body complex protein FliE n=1 Tax=Vogesella oryzae TaxID=1735285 RepID=UPI001581406E|nr:flagellar hook-basal body complex protein FliE [Vogesella oryzae]